MTGPALHSVLLAASGVLWYLGLFSVCVSIFALSFTASKLLRSGADASKPSWAFLTSYPRMSREFIFLLLVMMLVADAFASWITRR